MVSKQEMWELFVGPDIRLIVYSVFDMRINYTCNRWDRVQAAVKGEVSRIQRKRLYSQRAGEKYS
jgi:hypothetical protein